MRIYEGPQMHIQEPQQALDFFLTPSNFEQLMPDNNQSFSASDDSFSFQLKGMPAIYLSKVTENGMCYYKNSGGSVSFSLYLVENPLKFEVRGEINGMMHMMLQKPLTQLLQNFSTKLSALLAL